MLLIAHRGRVDDWPENVVESIPAALARADGLEVDVRLAADGVPVLMHDSSLSRTTGAPGTVEARSSDYLAQRLVHGRAPVPRLRDYLEAAADHDAPLVVLDLKDPSDACLEATAAATKSFPPERLLLAARTDDVLRALRALAPTARLASLGITVETVEQRIAGARACDAEALFVRHGDPAYESNRAVVPVIQSHGLIAAASTLRTARVMAFAKADGCGFALVDLPLKSPAELSEC